MDYALHLIEQDSRKRSRFGVPRPIFRKGDQVGKYRHYDEPLTMFILRARRPERYGIWIDRSEPRITGILASSGGAYLPPAASPPRK